MRSIQRDAVKILSPVGLEYATYEDLSAGGLKLWMDHALEPNARLSLEFSVRNLDNTPLKIKVVGRVVRCVRSGDGYTVGIQFLDLSRTTREAIEKLFQPIDGPF